MQSAIFSSEDREFMDAVNLDLNLFIKGNNLKSVKAVLVFPPFNNFRRFLVHKIVEDTYNTAGLSTFSIGQDFQRRIVVCHSALKLRLKTLQERTKLHSLADVEGHSRSEMIDKDVSKPRVSTNIYRPPAARSSANSSDSKLDLKPQLKDNRRSKVRRPDLQVYVPRPKRASYGDVEKHRSPPGSVDKAMSSRRDDSYQKRRKSLCNSAIKVNVIDAVDLTEDDSISPARCNAPNEECEMTFDEQVDFDKYIGSGHSSSKNKHLGERNDRLSIESSPIVNVNKLPDTLSRNHLENSSLGIVETKLSNYERNDKSVEINSIEDKPTQNIPSLLSNTNHSFKEELHEINSVSSEKQKPHVNKDIVCSSSINDTGIKEKHELTKNDKLKNMSDKNKLSHEYVEETLTISDDSQTATTDDSQTATSDDSQTATSSDDIISISSTITESSSDDSIDSSDSSSKKTPIKKCKHHKKSSKSNSKFMTRERTNESSSYDRKNDEKNLNPEERNLKNRRILHGKPDSDVLIISDPVEPLPKKENNISRIDKLPSTTKNKLEMSQENIKNLKDKCKSSDTPSTYNPDEYDWDTLFTDDGECLVPEFMDELTKNVGRVKITTAKSNYKPFQTDEERGGDGECIIEIYDFPAEFKTNDLLSVFAAYRNRSFHIKWVDDTHALGVFGSPVVADEVLATTLPFVKTRPIRQGIPESRIKARSLVLPPMERPKTCPALARRLVTGALGLRLPNASKEREAEKLVLKEAREKRRLDLKQRVAVWEGNFN